MKDVHSQRVFSAALSCNPLNTLFWACSDRLLRGFLKEAEWINIWQKHYPLELGTADCRSIPHPQPISVEHDYVKAALGSCIQLAGLNEDLMTQDSAVPSSVPL